MKTKLLFFIKTIFSCGLLYYLVKDVNFDEILNIVGIADKAILVLAFTLHIVGFIISAAKWKVLLKAQNIDSKMLYLIKSYSVAVFFNHFMPSTIGGDSVRAYDSWKLGENKSKAFAVIFIDRFIGFITLLLFVVVSMLSFKSISTNIPSLYMWVGFLCSLLVGILWFIISPPRFIINKLKDSSNKYLKIIGDKAESIIDALNQFKSKKWAISKAMLLSVLLQGNVVFYYYLISVALNFQISIINFLIIIPLTIFILMIPISVNGIGLRENTFVFFFSFYGVVSAQAIGFAWIEFFMLLILGVLGGIVYFLRNIKLI